MQPNAAPAPTQWYYLQDGKPTGPVDAGFLINAVVTQQLSPSVMVAQAGWTQWSPAASVWPNMPVGAAAPAQAGPPPLPNPAAPAPSTLTEIPLRCIAGPDAGKLLYIGSNKTTMGRLTGVGAADPLVANEHVTVTWREGKLLFQAYPGLQVIVNASPQTSGKLEIGQQFVIGSSTWQVGQSSVDVKGLLGSLAGRLNHLASTEKLEGFSLSEMFSEVFKKRTPEEVEDYFVVGTTRTTPPIDEVPTGWPKPWFFMRILMFVGLVYILFAIALSQFSNPNLIPGMIMMGSLAVPLATVFLFFELNTPRNVSFHQVLMLVCFGGVISLFVALIGFKVSIFGWLGAMQAGIIEEIGKLATVIIVCRQARYKYVLNGLLFGASVGAGFAIFESAGYAFNILLEARSIDAMTQNIMLRAFLSPFGHVAWTAIAAGALWRVKGDKPFSMTMLSDVRFWRAFLLPVVLHMFWNSPLPSPFFIRHLLVGVIAWYIVFGIVQQGLRQVREEQREFTKTKLRNTQQFALATGQFSPAEVTAAMEAAGRFTA